MTDEVYTHDKRVIESLFRLVDDSPDNNLSSHGISRQIYQPFPLVVTDVD